MTTAVTIAPPPILQFLDNTGRPAVGGSVLTQVGGVNTTTYQDAAGTIALPNPIPLNSRGEISNAAGASCQLFLQSGVVYTFTLYDANGNVLNQSLYVVASTGVTAAALIAATGAGLLGYSGMVAYPSGTVGARLQTELCPTDYPWLAVDDGLTDCTAAFQECLNEAAATGKGVFLPDPKVGYYLGNGTITLPPSVRIRANPGCTVRCGNPTSKTQVTDQGTETYVQFIAAGDGMSAYQALAPLVSKLPIEGVSFYNMDSTVATSVISAVGGFSSVRLDRCEFFGFTRVGVAGNLILLAGVNPQSDAQTCIGKAELIRCSVVSDTRDTQQAPKFMHMLGANDGLQAWNSIRAIGAGYCTRWAGGSAATVPVVGRGLANIKISMNRYVTTAATTEYNQVAKGTNISVVGDAGDASAAPSPFNMWDFFNCFNVTFNGNTTEGGGLAFFGHADLGNAPGQESTLVGARNFSAGHNTMINPTYVSVFELGGDVGVDTNCASHNVSIYGTTVTCLPGFTPPATCAFLYSFLVNAISLNGNTIQGLPVYIRNYFNKGIAVGDNETLTDVPTLVQNDGTDAASQGTHTYGSMTLLGSSGTINTIDQLRASVPYERNFRANIRGTGFWGERLSSGFVLNPHVTFSQDLSSTTTEGLVWEVTATLGTSLGVQTLATWVLAKSGTVFNGPTLLTPAGSGITCAISGNRVVLSNTTAGVTGTLTGTLTQRQ